MRLKLKYLSTNLNHFLTEAHAILSVAVVEGLLTRTQLLICQSIWYNQLQNFITQVT